MKKPIPLYVGLKLDKLTIIAQAASNNGRRWVVECVCGKTKTVAASSLRYQGRHSCAQGCGGEHRRTHGMAGTQIYCLWASMVSRCHNPKASMYPSYGARGIRVCDRWRKFQHFMDDVGPRPSLNHSLDRIDGTGNYEPCNVRWATREEQQNNLKTNRKLTFEGITLSIAQWERRQKLRVDTVRERLKSGWSVQKALTTRPRVTAASKQKV